MKKIVLLLIMGLLYLPSLTFAQTKNIDCNEKPSVPEGYTLVPGNPGGIYQLTPGNIKTVSFENKTSPITGEKMLSKLGDIALNACVLNYLMAHPETIPEAWKTKNVIFAGSIFADAGGNKFFPTLCWWNDSWDMTRTYLSEAYDDRIAAIK
jgi:hypothetical protein